MSHSHGNGGKNEKSAIYLLIAFTVFFVAVVLGVSVYFSGAFQTETTTFSPATPLYTFPPKTTETTPAITTAVTTTETITQTASESTTPEPILTNPTTTYPPATIPTITTTIPPETTVQTTPPPRFDISEDAMMELIDVRYLTIDDNSRPGLKLTELKNIVVHYTGNPGSSAENNWRHFENNKPGVSSHFIIGLNGEIIQCMPLDEVAWAIGTKEGNYTSISIECCHPDESGKFTEATYESLVRLVSWLCNKFGLDRNDVVRHYDYERPTSWGVYHKPCPLYWANDADPASHKRWEKFLDELILN